MDVTTQTVLTRREREVMEIIHRMKQATAADVQNALPDQPKYSAVRAILNVLEEKGHLKHSRASRRFIYEPTVSPRRAKRNALRNLLATFYEGSPEKLVSSLLNPDEQQLTESEIERIREMIADGVESDSNGGESA